MAFEFRAFGILAVTVLACVSASDTVPRDGMVVRKDTKFRPGTYALPHGISVGASDITLELSGVHIIGDFSNTSQVPSVGITISGYSGVKVVASPPGDTSVRGFYYGLAARNCSRLHIEGLDFSDNFVDPLSRMAAPPWLDIFVPADAFGKDRTNLGGGVFLESVDESTVSNVVARNNENGIDGYHVTRSRFLDCDVSNQTGWGLHLAYGSNDNLLQGNKADNCTRANLGDSSGLLLSCSSKRNRVIGNSFRYGGDGVYLAWTPSHQGPHPACCSNDDNVLEDNDGSFAGANAFESDFSYGCVFRNNVANGSNFGFWLG